MYIIQLSNSYFFKELNPIEISFTNKLNLAKTYESIGEAIKEAVEVQKQVDNYKIKVTSVSK